VGEKERTPVNVLQIQAARAELEKQVTALVVAFEQSTGCIVHSLPLYPSATGRTPVKVEVRVQVP
jgi:hypothetical protein